MFLNEVYSQRKISVYLFMTIICSSLKGEEIASLLYCVHGAIVNNLLC